MKIRFVQPKDERQAKKMLIRYLKETYEKGGDFPPTLENAAAFFDFALQGVAVGDPCLVAVHPTDTDKGEPKLAGFVGTQGVHFPGMTTRDNTIRSWGTFVLPEYRTTHIAAKLFMVMGRVAKNKGYTRVMSSTRDSEHAMRVINKIAGRGVKSFKEVGALLAWQLAAALEGDDHVESHNMPAAVLAADAAE